MGPVSGSGRSIRTMSGPMTSSRIARMTGASSACSTWSTSSPTNVWPSVWPASSRPQTSSTSCRICSCLTRRAQPHPLRQRARVRGPSRAGLDQGCGLEDGLHRPRLTLGEWLRRVVQRPAPGRTPERGDLLQPEGGGDRHRKLAQTLQHRPPARLPGIQAACSGGPHPSPHRPAGCAISNCSAGQAPSSATPNAALTFPWATQWGLINPLFAVQGRA